MYLRYSWNDRFLKYFGQFFICYLPIFHKFKTFFNKIKKCNEFAKKKLTGVSLIISSDLVTRWRYISNTSQNGTNLRFVIA